MDGMFIHYNCFRARKRFSEQFSSMSLNFSLPNIFRAIFVYHFLFLKTPFSIKISRSKPNAKIGDSKY